MLLGVACLCRMRCLHAHACETTAAWPTITHARSGAPTASRIARQSRAELGTSTAPADNPSQAALG